EKPCTLLHSLPVDLKISWRNIALDNRTEFFIAFRRNVHIVETALLHRLIGVGDVQPHTLATLRGLDHFLQNPKSRLSQSVLPLETAHEIPTSLLNLVSISEVSLAVYRVRLINNAKSVILFVALGDESALLFHLHPLPRSFVLLPTCPLDRGPCTCHGSRFIARLFLDGVKRLAPNRLRFF